VTGQGIINGKPFDVPDDAPGFPGCPSCPYRISGPSGLCYACARQTLDTLPRAQRCTLCDAPAANGEKVCGNQLCNMDHHYGVVTAVALRTDPYGDRIVAYKRDRSTPWATIFGRLLFEHIDRRADRDRDALIIPMPTYTGPGGHRDWDHTELILRRAAAEDIYEEHEFLLNDAPVLRATVATPRTSAAGASDWKAKRAAARTQAATSKSSTGHGCAIVECCSSTT